MTRAQIVLLLRAVASLATLLADHLEAAPVYA